MNLRPSAPKLLADRSLWPLWAILVLGAILLGARGCAATTGPDGALSPSAVRLTTVPDSPVVAGRPGGEATTRGPAGSPVTSWERRLAVCALDRLPAQVRVVVGRVRAAGPGGPAGGAVFDNSLGLLPPRPSGHYRRYDVPDPEAPDGGSRALVTGGAPGGAAVDWFYTWDERDSFCQITGL